MEGWQPFDEKERLALVREIREQQPNADLDNLLMGALAGPATPDRPDVPVWDYLTYAQQHPETPFSVLITVRFPVLLFGGVSSVTSVVEHLKPLPVSFRGVRPEPTYCIDAEAIIRQYMMLRDAGLIEWEPAWRGIRYTAPVDAIRPVMAAWYGTLEKAGPPEA